MKVLIIFQLLLYGVTGLTMDGVIVPPYVLQDDAAELRCKYTLEQDNLYSVTWYKDHEEFYRYVPKDNPKQHTYNLEGAKVDQQRSDAQVVRLRGALPPASGVYRCEVSAEAPSFTSVNGEGRMDVVSLPKDDPEISGDIFPRDYREGDVLALNCTASRSHPPAKLSWMINNHQVSPWFETPGASDRGTSSGLRLALSRHHFPRGELMVSCVATVPSLSPLFDVKTKIIRVRGSAYGLEFSWSLYFYSSLLTVVLKSYTLNLCFI